MITLHALTQSRTYRIAWLLEHLGLDYHAEIVRRNEQTQLAPESLRSIHPLGKSPLLQDGSLILPESGVIVEYLIATYDKTGSLRPAADSPNYPDYLFWLHYAEGSLMPLLVMSLVFRKIDQNPMPFFTDGTRRNFLNPQLELHLGFVEQKLQGKTAWLLGDTLTGADIMMSFPLQATLSRTELNLPNITAYVRRIESHPDYQKAEARLGKLTLL